MRLFDTHAHLDDSEFEGRLDAVLDRARTAGVIHVLTVGTTAESSQAAVQLASRHDMLSAAVGIQPNCCADARPGDWDKIVQLLDREQVVAIGETGLDRHWDDTPFALQQDYFDRHLRLSQERDLPFVVHMRECEQDVLKMLREARRRGPLRGIMHSFTGSLSAALECVELGLHISLAGMVTFPKSDELRRVAGEIPADRILVETDAPYLAPQPVRGKRPNEPGWVAHTAACLAEVRGTDAEAFAEQTTTNAQLLLGPPWA
jgi:TatD DNase family protein